MTRGCALVVCLVIACRTASAPDRLATLAVRTDTVRAQVTRTADAEYVSFNVEFAIQNAGQQPLTFLGFQVQESLSGEWKTVWTPLGMGPPALVEIKPGENVVVNGSVWAVLKGEGAPVWQSATFGGSHRLLAAFRPYDANGHAMTFASNAFVLVAQ